MSIEDRVKAIEDYLGIGKAKPYWYAELNQSLRSPVKITAYRYKADDPMSSGAELYTKDGHPLYVVIEESE